MLCRRRARVQRDPHEPGQGERDVDLDVLGAVRQQHADAVARAAAARGQTVREPTGARIDLGERDHVGAADHGRSVAVEPDGSLDEVAVLHRRRQRSRPDSTRPAGSDRLDSGPMPEPVLSGLRVIDLGHALAGPFAATLLADHGADVLKIEHPERGDPMRRLGPRKDGVPVWWKAAGRSKRSVALDFSTPRGREILLELVEHSDVLVENFRPGTLERRGLGWDDLHRVNPRLVMLRISGFGQHGPHASRPGFGRTAEAMSGAAQLTGFPDGPPIHVGYSLADTLTGLMGAFGIMLALHGRERSGEGDCIDLALYEPLFRLIDWQAIVYDQLGIAGMRAGNAFPAVLEGVAAGVAQTTDGIWLSYSAATDSVLERLVALMTAEGVVEPGATPRPRRGAATRTGSRRTSRPGSGRRRPTTWSACSRRATP